MQKEIELAYDLTLNEQFAVVINEYQEKWFDRANQHLEKLLEKANKDNDIQRRMAKHYAKRNKIARSKLKKANEKIETLSLQEEKIRLDILTEASFHA